MEELILQVCLMGAMFLKIAPYALVLGVAIWWFDLY